MSEKDAGELRVVHEIRTESQKAATEVAAIWANENWIVEIRPPSMIAGDDWHVLKKEWM